MTIVSTDFPSPDLVIPDLGDFLREAGEALDAGTAQARQHYEHRKREDIEAPLAAMITRSVVKERLGNYGLQTEDFETVDIPLIGIRVVLRGDNWNYLVAIWKSTDGDMPAPGHSGRRRYFLAKNQLALNLGIDWSNEEINLALVWNASPAFYLTDLYLHMPKGTAASFFKAPESYWSQKVPLPAELLESEDASQDRDDTLPYEKAEDEEARAEES